jgi:hypothetical protein
MTPKEKGRPVAGGGPIPTTIRQDLLESISQPDLDFQALQLNRQYGFAIETAATIASLAWGLAR